MKNVSYADYSNRILRPKFPRSPWVSWDEMTAKEKASYKKAEEEIEKADKKNSTTEQ